MKIIYKQSNDLNGSLCKFGVQECYFKKLSLERDCVNTTKKTHHHTGFEMHIVTEGSQIYEIQDKIYELKIGSFILIYPNVPHRVIGWASHTQKYSITFNKHTEINLDFFIGPCVDRMSDNLDFISSEAALKKEISSTLIENVILEILVGVFRLSGIKENEKVQNSDENMIVSLAKQYIDDNIELNLGVTDVAEYCYLSAKQLTRIFNSFVGLSPGEYITSARIAKIEKLLSDNSLSLKQISEVMNFNNEYYFNAFFKKYSGIPPGEFRKMIGQ